MYTTNGPPPLNFADTVEKWKPAEVAGWLRGLDDCVHPFVHLFVNKNVGGPELFTLDEGDLERIGVTNAAARRTISSALCQLSDLCYSLDRKNLQSLAMQMGVQARNLHNDLRYRLDRLSRDANAALGWLPNDVLSQVLALIDDTKEVINWLGRSPFDAIQEYVTVRNTILSFAGTIVLSARQPSCNLTQTARDIQMACTQLCAISDKIVEEFMDPMILQTAYLERAVVRRSNPVEEFGIDIESTTEGVHIVSDVKFQSPADFAGKIEPGDEIVQACGQTVVAWPLSKLALILSETRLSEAEFLLKKRPRNHYGHQTLTGKTATPATPKFPKANKATMVPLLASVQPLVPAPQQPHPKPRRRSSSVSIPRTPVEKIRHEVKTSPPGSPVSPIPYIMLPPNDQQADDGMLGGGIRQRRATVSGGSPTLKRLSLHLNRNISVSPRPQTQWFQDSAVAARNSERKDDLEDLDLARVRWKLDRPKPYYRASLIGNQLFVSPKDFSEYGRKLRKNSSVGNGFGDKFEIPVAAVGGPQSMDDDVFDEDILAHLAQQAVEAMPSDSSDAAGDEKRRSSSSSSDGSVLEEVASTDIPVEAKINDEEWSKPITDEHLRTPSDENKSIMSVGGGNVHKTWSYPGRDSTAPMLAQNPLATLPRSSQEKLKRFFGETSIGSSTWYDSEAEESFVVPAPRKSPMTSSQASVASSSTWSSRFPPRRPRLDLFNFLGGGGGGQGLHVPRKHREPLPSNSDGGSPVLTSMQRLASTRQQNRSTSTVDFGVVERTLRDNRKASAPVKSNVVNQQLLASLTSGGMPDATRLKLGSYLPCKSIGTPDHSGWAHRARCTFENEASKKWKKRWLVLKREFLFIYRSPEDTKAEGIIWLPSYKVCPTGPEYKTKKRNVFKLESTRSAFYFYCYHRQDMYQWLQKLGLAAIGYESQSNFADDQEASSGAEFYFVSLDDGSLPRVLRSQQAQSPSSSSPGGNRRNLLQPDQFLNTLRHSWRRSQLSRENSNESSLSCHSERAVSTSSGGQGSSKIIRDPLHVRGGGGFSDGRSRSAGRLEDDKDSA